MNENRVRQLAQNSIAKMLQKDQPEAPKRSCGDCTLCCKVMKIESDELNKPTNVWCQDCTKTKGCGIYETRPQPCRDFECLWLQYPYMDDALQPSKCHVVFTPTADGQGVTVHVDKQYPLAYKAPAVQAMIDRCAQHVQVYVVIGDKRLAIGRFAHERVRQVMAALDTK